MREDRVRLDEIVDLHHKVLKGIEQCLWGKETEDDICGECPYKSKCHTELLTDAYQLIKEQAEKIAHLTEKYSALLERFSYVLDGGAPHVMSLQEISQSNDTVWVEYISGKIRKVMYCYEHYPVLGFIDLDGERHFNNAEEYGIKWRCWNGYPPCGENTPWGGKNKE